MKKLRCIIVDDEPIARKILAEFAGQVPYLDTAGQFENAPKAEAWLQYNAADLVFLDIEMPKRSGLDWLRHSVLAPMVIITTAFPQYALEGYELDIIDYLLKPIAFSRFLKAAQKAKDYAALREAGPAREIPTYMFVRSDKRIEKVELKDILYIESVGNYVNLITDRKKILAYLTMKGIESQLPAQQFMKVHQSFLVNCTRIEAIEGNVLHIREHTVPVSRNYRDALMQLVDQRLLRR